MFFSIISISTKYIIVVSIFFSIIPKPSILLARGLHYAELLTSNFHEKSPWVSSPELILDISCSFFLVPCECADTFCGRLVVIFLKLLPRVVGKHARISHMQFSRCPWSPLNPCFCLLCTVLPAPYSNYLQRGVEDSQRSVDVLSLRRLIHEREHPCDIERQLKGASQGSAKMCASPFQCNPNRLPQRACIVQTPTPQ